MDEKQYIFDPIRKKYILLTPEEWVRQQIIVYLTEEKHYPPALISVEKQIKLGSKIRRYDLVIYKDDKPWLIIECKNENEKITQHTLSQLLSYNSVLEVSFLTITNGKQVLTYDLAKANWDEGFPTYL